MEKLDTILKERKMSTPLDSGASTLEELLCISWQSRDLSDSKMEVMVSNNKAFF